MVLLLIPFVLLLIPFQGNSALASTLASTLANTPASTPASTPNTPLPAPPPHPFSGFSLFLYSVAGNPRLQLWPKWRLFGSTSASDPKGCWFEVCAPLVVLQSVCCVRLLLYTGGGGAGGSKSEQMSNPEDRKCRDSNT